MSSSAFPNPAQTWNQRFSEPDFLFGTQPNAWLEQHAKIWAPGAKLLCVADGEGRNSVWLAAQGHAVDAFDIAEAGVAKAQRLAAEAGVQVNFSVADCERFAWPLAHYDGIAAIFIQFADPALRARLFARMVQSLKPGGILILQGYTPKQLDYKTGGPPVLSHLYTADLLRNLLADLEIQVLEEYEAELQEGSGHRGRSALMGLLAKKPLPPKR